MILHFSLLIRIVTYFFLFYILLSCIPLFIHFLSVHHVELFV
nr:MAG TPA: hypothetical protein [Caudoviricetes sp.]